MNRTRSLKSINYSQALLIAGLIVSLAVIMFRPAGADAVLPKSVQVYPTWEGDTSDSTTTVTYNELSPITRDYNVILKGDKKSTPVSLTGYSLVDFLKQANIDTKNVGFVKIRIGSTDDSYITIQPLDQDSPDRPPIIMTSGKKPGVGAWNGVPFIVPGQPDEGQPIKESNFIGFNSKVPLRFVPGKPGAKIMGVHISSKKLSSGEYKLTADVVAGGSSSSKSYQWYGTDSKGQPVKLDGKDSRTITTTDATTGSQQRVLNVVVTESSTGSTGTAGFQYDSKKKTKGTTKNPYPPTNSTGGTTTGSGTGTTGTGTGTGTPGSSTTVTPNQYGAQQSTPSIPTAPTSQPTASTSTPEATSTNIDTTAITNAAQNVNGTGGLKTVSGVLLSAPTVAPAAAGASGTPLTALPQSVATELNTIFKPVDSTDDVWAYLIAVLFAFSISGAVREWVNP